MGVMTAAEMAAELRLNLNRPDLTDAQAGRWLNWSYLHVSSPRIYRHRELITEETSALTTGTRTYVIAANASIAVQSVVIHHPDQLTVDANRHERYSLHPLRDRAGHDQAGTRANGRPEWYEIAPGGTNLALIPAPSATYNGWTLSVRRIRRPVLLDVAGTPTGTTAIDAPWDEVIVAGATWRGYRALKEPLRSEHWKVEFGQLVNEVTDRVRLEAEDFEDGPPVVWEDSMDV